MTRIVDVTSELSKGVTPELKASFEKNGFLHFRNFLDMHAVEAMREAMAKISDQWVQQDLKVLNGTPIKYGNDVDGRRIVQRFCFASQYHPVLEEMVRDPRLKTLLSLGGSGARFATHEKDGLVINHYVNSSESNFTQMGWHTDSVRDLFLGKKMNPMLNVGIHLDDQDPINGGLRILPGTHKQSKSGILFHKVQFLDNRPDPREVAFDIKAGDLTVHDGRAWHRVQRSSLIGEASRRRVMYIPIIEGEYQPKTADSKTPFYHRFQGFVK